MADHAGLTAEVSSSPPADRERRLDEARVMARQRFKERLGRGEQIGECACHDEESQAAEMAGTGAEVCGVRFRDSGRTYYFRPGDLVVAPGDWVVVETNRGLEAGRVVIAPHQVRLSQLQGELRQLVRRLDEADVERMNGLKREAGRAVKTFGAMIREGRLPLKPISAEYNFDGSRVVLNYASGDRLRLDDFAQEVSDALGCAVELKQVGPRDEARLLGGLGRCGRTLCCSSWLPVYPDISMNMAKTQDLALNPTKVSGVCGRLLCCLSYENEQYRQMKAVMPRLGHTIETPLGRGMVVSLQVIRELVTVRLDETNADHTFPAAELGLGPPSPVPDVSNPVQAEPAEPARDQVLEADSVEPPRAGSRRRRRRQPRSQPPSAGRPS